MANTAIVSSLAKKARSLTVGISRACFDGISKKDKHSHYKPELMGKIHVVATTSYKDQ